ncbi:MAG: DUF342 domain-containing protein [Nitrospinae bacterium]|nr:DUF342 domain-containing protein [Nitrospinota bacterium]
MRLPEQIRKLIGLAQVEAGILASRNEGDTFSGLLETLDKKIKATEDFKKKQEFKQLLGEFKMYFSTPAPKGKYEDNNGTLNITVHSNGEKAFLTLVPPRENGRYVTLNNVLAYAKEKGVSHGLDFQQINKVIESCQKKKDIILMALIAKGEQPQQGSSASYKFAVSIVDFDTIIANPASTKSIIKKIVRVKKGMTIAQYLPEKEGINGFSVTGKKIDAQRGEVPDFLISEKIKCDNGKLVSLEDGVVIKKGRRILLEDIYHIDHSIEGNSKKLFFNGLIVVEGDVRGPIEIAGEFIVITGKLHIGTIFSSNDTIILGGIFGKKQTSVFSNGRVLSFSASDCSIKANEDILIANNLCNANVTTASKLITSPQMGTIIGGSIHAMKGIDTKSLGVSFGMYTEASVGNNSTIKECHESLKDRLNSLEEIYCKMKKKKENILWKYSSINKMPLDKQDMFIEFDQRVRKLEDELRYFERFLHGIEVHEEGSSDASIKVHKSIYPHVRVEVYQGVKEIEEEMESVIIGYNTNQGVIIKGL